MLGEVREREACARGYESERERETRVEVQYFVPNFPCHSSLTLMSARGPLHFSLRAMARSEDLPTACRDIQHGAARLTGRPTQPHGSVTPGQQRIFILHQPLVVF